MGKTKRKHNHRNKILKEIKIPEGKVLPGMILWFEYTKKNVFDVKPLVLVLSIESGKIDGINLNYMNEYDLQRMFSVMQSLTPVIKENILKLPNPYMRLQLSNRLRPTSISGKNIYDRIKAKNAWKNAFRTYNLKVATSVKLINYDLDILGDGDTLGKKTTAETLRRLNKAKQDKGIEDAD